MAISPVDKIPELDKPATHKSLILADLHEAINKEIPIFEIVGDYKYETMHSYVRAIARDVFKREYCTPAVKSIKPSNGTKRDKTDIGELKSLNDCCDEIISVQCRKLEDRKHIYVQINLEKLKSFRTDITFGHYNMQ